MRTSPEGSTLSRQPKRSVQLRDHPGKAHDTAQARIQDITGLLLGPKTGTIRKALVTPGDAHNSDSSHAELSRTIVAATSSRGLFSSPTLFAATG